jgi:hypothetical protein
MNKAQANTLKEEISRIEDNLARARAQKWHGGEWLSAAGEDIDTVIKKYEKQLQDLQG